MVLAPSICCYASRQRVTNSRRMRYVWLLSHEHVSAAVREGTPLGPTATARRFCLSPRTAHPPSCKKRRKVSMAPPRVFFTALTSLGRRAVVAYHA